MDSTSSGSRKSKPENQSIPSVNSSLDFRRNSTVIPQ